jgi:hypothetical protein
VYQGTKKQENKILTFEAAEVHDGQVLQVRDSPRARLRQSHGVKRVEAVNPRHRQQVLSATVTSHDQHLNSIDIKQLNLIRKYLTLCL